MPTRLRRGYDSPGGQPLGPAANRLHRLDFKNFVVNGGPNDHDALPPQVWDRLRRLGKPGETSVKAHPTCARERAGGLPPSSCRRGDAMPPEGTWWTIHGTSE